jgi:HK97 family phage prohead protease
MSKRENFFLPGHELRVKTDADGSRSLVGTIPYNSPSSGLPWREFVAPGAFADGLKAGADVLCLRDHDPCLLLGRTTAGTLSLKDSPEGLQFRCKLPATSAAADLLESIGRKDITGVSFGFTVIDDLWADDGAGNLVRTLRAVTLWELSVCSFAAYPDSKVSIRSVPTELRSLLKRSKSEDDDCGCECDACEAGDCSDCEDEDCEDPNCDHGNRSRQKAYMRLELAKRK